MRVTYLGHAGLFIETAGGSILCDPFFSPAYYASWFPFPSNEDLDLDTLSRADYLYVSHLHRDHFDPAFLARHVHKDATVLLPAFPVDGLERGLREAGFSRFCRFDDRVPKDLDGLRVMIAAEITPADGPLGDSSLCVDDGTARLLNQNDARPREFDSIRSFGHFDAHFLQFSGAIWYPLVYALSPEEKAALSRDKRERGMDRARRFVEQVGADHIFPSAGPPCFLDRDLFVFNDLDGTGNNPFPDQTVFLDFLARTDAAEGKAGSRRGHLVVPGSVATLSPDPAGGPSRCEVEQPGPYEQIMAPFTDKRAYLEAYRERQRPVLEAAHASWPVGQLDIAAELKGWWEPLLAQADHLCAAVGGPVLFQAGDTAVVIDFPAREVRPYAGEACVYRYFFDQGPVEAAILAREDDWINGLFLSMRFTAERDGPYNEYIYSFFKCLSEERMRYAEGCARSDHLERVAAGAPSSTGDRAARVGGAEDWIRIGDYWVQRRCPHLRADLSRFGELEGTVLTCQLHGWQFDLATGRCLTSDDRRIRVHEAGDGDEPPQVAAQAPTIGH